MGGLSAGWTKNDTVWCRDYEAAEERGVGQRRRTNSLCERNFGCRDESRLRISPGDRLLAHAAGSSQYHGFVQQHPQNISFLAVASGVRQSLRDSAPAVRPNGKTPLLGLDHESEFLAALHRQFLGEHRFREHRCTFQPGNPADVGAAIGHPQRFGTATGRSRQHRCGAQSVWPMEPLFLFSASSRKRSFRIGPGRLLAQLFAQLYRGQQHVLSGALGAGSVFLPAPRECGPVVGAMAAQLVGPRAPGPNADLRGVSGCRHEPFPDHESVGWLAGPSHQRQQFRDPALGDQHSCTIRRQLCCRETSHRFFGGLAANLRHRAPDGPGAAARSGRGHPDPMVPTESGGVREFRGRPGAFLLACAH